MGKGRKRKTAYKSKELSVSQSDKQQQQKISDPSLQFDGSENLHQSTNTLKACDVEFLPNSKPAHSSTSFTSRHNLVDSALQNHDYMDYDLVSAMDSSATTTSDLDAQTQQTNKSRHTDSADDGSQSSTQTIASSTPAPRNSPPSPAQNISKHTQSILSPIQEEVVESLSSAVEDLELSPPETEAKREDSPEHASSVIPTNPDTPSSTSQQSTTGNSSTDNTPSDAKMGKKNKAKKKNKNKKPTPEQETTGVLSLNPEEQQPQVSTITSTLVVPRTDFEFPRNTQSNAQTARRRRGGSIALGPGQLRASLLSQPVLFSYNFDNAITRCWLPSCRQRTVSDDNKTVICPRCTERSYVRYCCTEHLLADFYRHYTTGECKHRDNLLLIDEATIMPFHRPVHEFIEVENPAQYDSLERVRQAIYYSQPPVAVVTVSEDGEEKEKESEGGDYFIFSDVDLLLAGEPDDGSVDVRSPQILAKYRGTGEVVATVKFEEDSHEKRRFGNALGHCLKLGYAAGTANAVACRLLFIWLREELVAMGVWDDRMVTRVCFAMQLEFGYKAPEHLCTV